MIFVKGEFHIILKLLRMFLYQVIGVIPIKFFKHLQLIYSGLCITLQARIVGEFLPNS